MSAATAIRERPILMSGPMVCAILSGTKTMTRRVVKPQPPERDGRASNPFRWERVEQVGEWFHILAENPHGMFTKRCPYGAVGDQLWVRETFWANGHDGASGILLDKLFGPREIMYDATREIGRDGKGALIASKYLSPRTSANWQKRPSIFMPRWASRLSLEITGIRVERVQEISYPDIRAEGVDRCELHKTPHTCCDRLRLAYALLWDSLNAKRGYSWESNPWVWVLEFRRAHA